MVVSNLLLSTDIRSRIASVSAFNVWLLHVEPPDCWLTVLLSKAPRSQAAYGGLSKTDSPFRKKCILLCGSLNFPQFSVPHSRRHHTPDNASTCYCYYDYCWYCFLYSHYSCYYHYYHYYCYYCYLCYYYSSRYPSGTLLPFLFQYMFWGFLIKAKQ